MALMVRFDHYGDVDVLQVIDAPVRAPGPGEALVRVKAASINPGEASIRKGLLHVAGRPRSPPARGATSQG